MRSCQCACLPVYLWTVKQMGHTSKKMLDEHYAKWISEDTPPIAMIVNKVFGFVEGNEVQNTPHVPQNKKAGFEPAVLYRI